MEAAEDAPSPVLTLAGEGVGGAGALGLLSCTEELV